MGKFIDLSGKKIGKLTVIKPNGKEKNGSTKWLCRCECGKEKTIAGSNLIRGTSTSCGCYQREVVAIANTKHGLHDTRLYKVMQLMKRRCYNSKDKGYLNYGGRGIKICDEWLEDFNAFREWALANGYDENAPKGRCTIDRIDVNGDYEPKNCRWISTQEQSLNKRTNHLITYRGKTQTVTQWAKEIGIKRSTLFGRLHKGWTEEKALSTELSKVVKNDICP